MSNRHSFRRTAKKPTHRRQFHLLESLESRRVLAAHPLYFSPPTDYAAGDSPNSVAVGDFNLDGKADIATANITSSNVTIRLGSGDGTFGSPATIAGGPANRGVFVGDFNNDSKPDLAISVENVGVPGAGDVRVLLGNGNGTFGAATVLPSVGNPTWLQFADLNADTRLDIVSGNGTGNSLSVFLGNGNGTFQPRVDLATGLGSNPFTATVGDFNNDGKLDLISSNTGPGTGIPNGNDTVTVFLGNGSGTSFSNAGSITVGDGPGIAVASDFNSDGKLDLAVQNFTSGTVSVLIGNGNGTFAAPVNYATGPNNSSVAAGDFNGDGTIDLATSSFNAATAATVVGQVKVLLGNPNGTFQAAVVTRNVGHLPGGLAVGDFDGDGLDDIAAPNNLDDDVSILLNRDQLIVNTTSDAVADDALISLREAITFANTHANSLNAGGVRDSIRFRIPGSGAHTIAPSSNLPQITDPVIIDGTSQPGYAGKPLIVINGANVPTSTAFNLRATGLWIAAGNSVVQGMCINGFQTILTPGIYNGGTAIFIIGGTGNVIQGNFLGTNADGTASVANTGADLDIESANNLIGGAGPGQRNLISGNGIHGIDIEFSTSFGNVVQGNLIGTDITGNVSLSDTGFGASGFGPFSGGVTLSQGAHNNTIGGSDPGEGNVISGHQTVTNGVVGGAGIFVQSAGTSNNIIQGNLIGTNASGTAAVPNGSGIGVFLDAANNTIGGIGPGERNIIAHNVREGVFIDAGTGFNIRGNSIYANGDLGIDLGRNGITLNDNFDSDVGENTLQNFPVLLLPVLGGPTTTVQGSLNSTPSSTFTIDFYASAAADDSGYGEGQTWIGSTTVTTNASGNASFTVTLNVSLSSGVITATATNATGNTSEFSLAPVNHNPAFTSPATFSIVENTTAVGTITTSDSDLPAQTVTLAITGGPDAGKFSLSGGSLNLINPADFESPGDANGNNIYEVQVTATDGFGGSAVQNILVNITPVNDNSPLFTSAAAFSVAENTTAVTTVVATDADLPSQTITFSIVGGDDAGRFSITSGGLLTFSAAPNFESPNDADHNNVYLVRVQANDNAGRTTWQDIAVSVTGVNDNSPVFTSSSSFSVPENSSAVGLIAASDADLPGQSVTFSITGGVDAARFALTSGGTLTFNSPPDFESPADVGANNVYNLQITANDGAGGMTVQNISVTVTPVNDNSPVFTSSSTSGVAENSTSVVALTATDADLPSQTVTFSITGGVDAGKFTIGSGNALQFITTPDYESPTDANQDNVYLVQVTASDGTNTTVQGIAVAVTPLNDNNPVFASATAFSVPENDTAVTTVAATDADLPSQTVTFSIVGGDDAGRFSITSGGALTFSAAPNFESPTDADHNNLYLVRVQANDNAGRTTWQDIAITVTDVNDASPVFTTSSSFSVPENSSAVGLIAATDADLPAQTVTFNITGGADAARFTLTSGGTLTFNPPPDYESPADAGADNVYNLQVTADDGAGRTTVQNIAVMVTPVNDNSPVFILPVTFTTPENTAAVGTVAATDADQPVQTATFALNGGDDAGRFTISSNGVLTFTSPPDYESPTDANGDNVYLVRVKASDGAGGSTTQEIAVTVTGGNDFSPVFTSGPSFNVDENNTAITTVAATDADLPAQTIAFSISGGDDASKFTITGNGVLQFVSPPDFEAFGDANHDNVYNVIVSASDGAGGVTTQTINITIGNVNDHSPVFASSGSLTVPENTTTVGTVTATDADLPPQTITYSITGGADAMTFSVTSGGVLTFNAAPDFEHPSDADLNNTYQVLVTADDGNGATTTQTIVVTVTGLNDNSPVFASPATYSVLEGTTAVGTAVATDADLPGQTITYSISGGADAADFTITSGGEISFISPPNFEAPGDVGGDNVYNLQIQASDGAGGITIQNVAVAVGDVNETLGQVFLSGRVLMILGTNDPDHVVVNTQGRGTIKVHADFLPTNFVTFPLASVDRIEARLFGGDDQMTVAGNVELPALMDGGVGNDQLNAGGGPTILLGGQGGDQLSGGSANSLFIGGLGADRLIGGAADDLLIGGTTAYDSNDTALLAILSEWSSSRSYDARVANIRGIGTGPRLNGSFFLTKGTGATVVDDADIDKATGAAGNEWFLLDLASDVANDRNTKERLN